MLIIDGDYPMAYGGVDLDRDLTLPIDQVRTATDRRTLSGGWPDGETMASLPEMRKGGVAAALVKVAGRIRRPNSPIWGYRTGHGAYAAAQAHLAYYEVLAAEGEARVLATSAGFAAHMREWSEAEDHSALPVGFIIGMEGADPILWPEQVHEWWERGLRVISLSHYGVSTYSHGTGTGTEGGLFPPAEALLRDMDSLGMILDVTHTSDRSVREAIAMFDGPLLASHQNCRAVSPGERQQPDDILLEVIARDGVIGHSMDTWMLYRDGIDWANVPSRRDVFAREEVTLDSMVDHVDHISQLAGNTLHSAIGGDTDGQGGRDGAPYEIDTVADYQKLVDALDRRGYSSDDIENIMYRNWQRFYEKHLPQKEGRVYA